MVKKTLLMLLGLVLLITVSGLSYLYIALPDAGPAPDITVEGTPQQVERGRYLAHHVASCIDCHSVRDWSRLAGPIRTGTEGKGGDVFDENMGFPGTFYAKNITPFNLKEWSDGEIYRTITTGINRDGEPIFPVMPWPFYSRMDPEDVKAIIAYIRTLEPVESVSPPSKAHFPVNLVMRTLPKPAEPLSRPDPSDTIPYGKYLTTIAACAECHTQKVQGQPVDEMFFAGGFEFRLPGGIVRSANLTPGRTGIGNWTEEQFVSRFKRYDMPVDSILQTGPTDFNTVMPWTMYAGMKDEDLKAIFAYLKSLDPIENTVIKFSPAAQVSALN